MYRTVTIKPDYSPTRKAIIIDSQLVSMHENYYRHYAVMTDGADNWTMTGHFYTDDIQAELDPATDDQLTAAIKDADAAERARINTAWWNR